MGVHRENEFAVDLPYRPRALVITLRSFQYPLRAGCENRVHGLQAGAQRLGVMKAGYVSAIIGDELLGWPRFFDPLYRSSSRIVTGPSRPDLSSGCSRPLLAGRSNFSTFVRVKRCPGGSLASPINRFGQRLFTRTSSEFSPLRTDPLILTRNGCVQRTPRSLPLSRTSASSLTSPRSSQRGRLTSSRVNCLRYVAVPE